MTLRCSSHHVGFACSRALVGTKAWSFDPISDGALVGVLAFGLKLGLLDSSLTDGVLVGIP